MLSVTAPSLSPADRDALRASSRRRTPASNKKIAPEKEARTLNAEHESDVLKVLRWQMDQDRAISLKSKPMFDYFAPMVRVESGGTVVAFNPYDYQSSLVLAIEENSKVVIVKSRQMGISETICCYLLMRAVTEPGFTAIVFSKTLDDSGALGRRIRHMAQSLGLLCPEFASESDKKLSFKRLGSISFLPGTSRSARGIASVSVIFFDEAAFIDGIDGIYQAAGATTSMLGDRAKFIFNSTPNGRSGLFYRLMISGAEDKKRALQACKDIGAPTNNIKAFERLNAHTKSWVTNGWSKVFLHWRVHPIYGKDPEWANKKRTAEQLTQSQWDQEFELAFSEGSSAVFPPDLVEAAASGQWSEPIAGRKYVMGIDPSFGGSDNFVSQVWEVNRGRYSLVSEYSAARTSKTINIHRTIELIDQYKPINVNIEVNSGGGIILEDLSKKRSAVNWGEVITGNKSKIENTDRLALLMEQQAIEFPIDSNLAEEMTHFVEQIGAKMQATTRTRSAEAGFHDDSVMAAAIAFAKIDEWVNRSNQSNLLEGILK
jgi:Terminase RNaseH-like domain